MSKADLVKEIFRESKTLSVLHHKNIIELERTFLNCQNSILDNGTTTAKNELVLIMEYVPDGELKKLVMDRKGLSETEGKIHSLFLELLSNIWIFLLLCRE